MILFLVNQVPPIPYFLFEDCFSYSCRFVRSFKIIIKLDHEIIKKPCINTSELNCGVFFETANTYLDTFLYGLPLAGGVQPF